MNRSLIHRRRKSEAPAARDRDYSNPFDALQRQMNTLFEDFLEDFGAPNLPSLWGGTAGAGEIMPSFEVAETDEAVTVTAELPGMDEKDIEVSLDDNVLTISGEKKEERDDKEKDYRFSERRYGRFQRSVPLPAGIKQDDISASFKKGVLNVVLPKSEESRKSGRRIAISSE